MRRLGRGGARVALLVVLMVSVSLVAACDPNVVVTRASLTLKLPASDICQPPAGTLRVEVVAAGDFPSTDRTVEVLTEEDAPSVDLDGFPLSTRVLAISLRSEGGFVAGGLHRRVAVDTEDSVLLLPFGRSCAVPDAVETQLRNGAAVAPLPDGGYLVVGGLGDGGDGRREIRVVPRDESLVADPELLTTRRVGASATRSGDYVIIAGGAEGDDLAAEETFERYDSVSGIIDPEVTPMCSGVAGRCPRRDHGATMLRAGSVLLVGGVSQRGAEPLGTAVAIDPESRAVDEGYGPLSRPRRLPVVVTLDDGRVVVAGGFDGTGALVTAIETLDPAMKSFAVASAAGGALSLPDRSDLALVALPGGRLVALGGRGELEDRVSVFRFTGATEGRRTDVALRDFVPLSEARAVALPDARILLTGVDESGRARAFRVDVGRGVWEESGAPSRPVGALVLCDDGAIAEVGPIGAAYRRESLRTRYDNPPDTLFAADADWLALDVPSAYAERASEGLEALADGAPIMVPTLVFEDVVVMPTVAGAYRLVFTDDSGRTRTVSVDPERVSVDACEVMRGSEATFTATRRGDRVTIETSVDSRECPLADLVGGVRIELRLATTSRFQALSLARL